MSFLTRALLPQSPVTEAFGAWSLLAQGSDLEDEDMEELLNDTRLLKKFKKGRITEEELEKGLLTSARGSIRTAGLGASDVEGDG